MSTRDGWDAEMRAKAEAIREDPEGFYAARRKQYRRESSLFWAAVRFVCRST